MGMSRLLASTVLAVTLALPAGAQARLSAREVNEDFKALWSDVNTNYAYLDRQQTRWQDVPALYRSDLKRVRTRRELVTVIEAIIDELHDPHAQLTVNTATSPRLVPSGTDLWAAWNSGKAIVTEVRAGSDADRAEIQAGAEVVAINGVAVSEAVKHRLGRAVGPKPEAAPDWALRAVLAGWHGIPRDLDLLQNGTRIHVSLPAADQFSRVDGDRMRSATLDDSIGFIRINDALGDNALIGDFDAALARLRGTRALILDLRDTPGGGNSTVARAILGRFIDQEMPYQKHLLPSEERETGIRRSWVELVSPRGPFTYTRPVVILVDHWTGSMGEGIAIGFDGMKGATVVGTEMAGLLGATEHMILPHSGIGMNLPTEKLFHVNGTPREQFRPPVYVDVVADRSATKDKILEEGLRVARQRLLVVDEK